jgi:hypothetical protein
MAGKSIHIGLNRVDPAAYNGWDGALGGCVNDANSMRDIAASLGYAHRLLLNEQATSLRVLEEISGAARSLAGGDILLVTYSGHGGQVYDTGGDEDDNMDETWVLYDREVVDDELAALWSQFAEGVRIVVLSDSCHSGTVAKQKFIDEARAKNPGGVGALSRGTCRATSSARSRPAIARCTIRCSTSPVPAAASRSGPASS